LESFSVKLKDSEFYRIRVGMYRVIYSIKDDILLIVVVRIAHLCAEIPLCGMQAHRKEAYR